jgi:hypothetical protein
VPIAKAAAADANPIRDLFRLIIPSHRTGFQFALADDGAIERPNLAALSPLKLHLRQQAIRFFLFTPVFAASVRRKPQKVSLSSI